ncbi:hypothetical protein BC829DRAFT_421162 [Chytridium lagenaria]|nr:hypothetical protein BC829DRAFT_421162 [Chytridium lagenaria]
MTTPHPPTTLSPPASPVAHPLPSNPFQLVTHTLTLNPLHHGEETTIIHRPLGLERRRGSTRKLLEVRVPFQREREGQEMVMMGEQYNPDDSCDRNRTIDDEPLCDDDYEDVIDENGNPVLDDYGNILRRLLPRVKNSRTVQIPPLPPHCAPLQPKRPSSRFNALMEPGEEDLISVSPILEEGSGVEDVIGIPEGEVPEEETEVIGIPVGEVPEETDEMGIPVGEVSEDVLEG